MKCHSDVAAGEAMGAKGQFWSGTKYRNIKTSPSEAGNGFLFAHYEILTY
jgi:hypothetical protein